jgi:hypothetical protein
VAVVECAIDEVSLPLEHPDAIVQLSSDTKFLVTPEVVLPHKWRVVGTDFGNVRVSP